MGGHSKGGNLAVYSAVFCGEAVQNQLMRVYNNDGPGFRTSLLGLPEPVYHHHRLVTDAEGRKLSKSDRDTGLAELRGKQEAVWNEAHGARQAIRRVEDFLLKASRNEQR